MAAKAKHAEDAPAIIWFRQDLRLADNPALRAAIDSGRPVTALYVLDDMTPGAWRWGGASRWWLHQSLEKLSADLEGLGVQLVLRGGPARDVVPDFARETNAAALFWNRLYEPFAVERDADIRAALRDEDVETESFNAACLFEPWTVKTNAGDPYRVFTPYWRSARTEDLPADALSAPERAAPCKTHWPSDALHDWALCPTKPDWAGGLRKAWRVGERAANERLGRFIEDILADYPETRDFPGVDGVSRLSPHLHWGEISPKQVIAAVNEAARGAKLEKAKDKFFAELGWREFCRAMLFHNPHASETNLDAKFDDMPWRDDDEALEAWKRGRTGYPIVDAAMRELWETGWMHNRARMIAASFLIKHLLIDWRIGASWFWDTLVDADLANNSMGWQWVAGSGPHAQPYYRIFNPIAQLEKFDPDAAYVRRWVGELSKASEEAIFSSNAETARPKAYPAPIVDHAKARARALEAFDAIRIAA